MVSGWEVLIWSLGAAGAAAFGAVPLIARSKLPGNWLGWSDALAAGMMLAAAFLLTQAGDDLRAVPFALGAVAGVGFVHILHRQEDDENLGHIAVRQVVFRHARHSAWEGVAIGSAMSLDRSFGVFMVVAIAVHNIPEGTVLSAQLRDRGIALLSATAMAVVSNAGQVVFAVASYLAVRELAGLTPWALGFATGALIHLVLSELLPGSYRRAGETSIALVAIVAMGLVVLVGGVIAGG